MYGSIKLGAWYISSAILTLIFTYEMLILPEIFTMFSKVIHSLNTFTLCSTKNNIKSKLGRCWSEVGSGC
jgi:hypothetical protein